MPEMPDASDALSLEDVSLWLQSMPIVRHLGAKITSAKYGQAEIEMPYQDALSFRPGAIQAGAIGALIDFAGGAAVLTTLAPGRSVTTFDFSIKMIAPAIGTTLIARAKVPAPKHSINVSHVEVIARSPENDVLCATGTVTMLTPKGP